MSLSTLFGYAVLIVAAVCLDVAVTRWRRRQGQPAARRRRNTPVGPWLAAAYRRVAAGLAPAGAAAASAAARLPNLQRRFSQPAPAAKTPPAARPPAPSSASQPAAGMAAPTSPRPAPAALPPVAPASPDPQPAPAAAQPASAAAQPAPVASRPAAMAALPVPQVSLPAQASGPLSTPGTPGMARVNVSVELPVGSTIRLTIETSPGLEPHVTVDSPQRPWLAADAPAVEAPAAPLGLGPAPEPAQSTPEMAEPAPAAAPMADTQAQPFTAPAPELVAAPESAPHVEVEPLPAAAAAARAAVPVTAVAVELSGAVPPAANAPAATQAPASLYGLSPEWLRRLGRGWRIATDIRDQPLAMVLFGVSLVVYLLTHFIGLDRFPIYFFTDEAVQTLQAANLVLHGFRDPIGNLLPTYFQNGVYYNLSLSVYAQVLPYLLFGKSIWVTRGTPALLSLLAPLSACLALKNIFKVRWWWLGAMLLIITPAWFLHSRTGFETVIMVAFYGAFLYTYLLYRYRDPRYLYACLIFGALAFYSYNGGQFTVVVTGLLLGLSDLPYHWKNRQTGWRGLVLLAVLVVPYIRFVLQHPGATGSQLRNLDSYWVNGNLSLSQKLGMFFSEYIFGLSPQYWFSANNGRDLVRHIMKGYGHISVLVAPFFLVGLYVCLRHIREAAHRVLLIGLLAAPIGGAITSVGITRVLVFVLPVALVTALGVDQVWTWLRVRQRWWRAAAVGVFALMSLFAFSMLYDALVNGPTWYNDYELGGLQWGARQLFAEQIPPLLAADPQVQVYVSPSWANGTELFPQFFLNTQQLARVQLQGVAYYLAQKQDLPPDLIVVLPPEEYSQVDNNPKFIIQKVEQVLNYPNGQPGFYFLRLSYSDQAEAIFAQEKAALLKPVVETYSLQGQDVVVTHPRFGAGQLSDMLDGDTFTLVNFPSFNPVVLDFAFSAARPMTGLTITTGSMPDFTITAQVYADATSAPQVYTQRFVNLPPDPTVKLEFSNGPASVAHVNIQIQDNTTNGPGVNIHVREVDFR